MPDPETIAALGTELIRLGSILRLHPQAPENAFNKPDIQIPILIATLNVSDNGKNIQGAFIEECEVAHKRDLLTLNLSIKSYF